MQDGTRDHDVECSVGEGQGLNGLDPEVAGRQACLKLGGQLAHTGHRARIGVYSTNVTPHLQQVEEIAPRTATGIQHAIRGQNAAFEELVEEVDVDLAEGSRKVDHDRLLSMFKRLFSAALLISMTSGAVACGNVVTGITPITQINISFASRIQQNGSAWKGFVVPTAGTVTAQLTSISQTDGIIELGLGRISGSNCIITDKVEAAPNATSGQPHLTVTYSQGDYCVQVKDVGKLTTIVDFTVLVITPAVQ